MPCSHWFQMYSTLAMGATTHKVQPRTNGAVMAVASRCLPAHPAAMSPTPPPPRPPTHVPPPPPPPPPPPCPPRTPPAAAPSCAPTTPTASSWASAASAARSSTSCCTSSPGPASAGPRCRCRVPWLAWSCRTVSELRWLGLAHATQGWAAAAAAAAACGPRLRAAHLCVLRSLPCSPFAAATQACACPTRCRWPPSWPCRRCRGGR